MLTCGTSRCTVPPSKLALCSGLVALNPLPVLQLSAGIAPPSVHLRTWNSSERAPASASNCLVTR